MNQLHLVIVESPTKAGTIKSYLGKGYKVTASVGHIRDLPKSTLGVDIENGFTPKYINIRGKGDLIKELKKEAKAADVVYLATDPDREGEAISWHLSQALDIPQEKIRRAAFNEITKNAVKTAVKNPREIDMNLVDSQQARRILDRIVGYKLSPVLWKKIKSGLSAGRVQSVATRFIVERENEIRAFVPEEYWSIDANLVTAGGKKIKAAFFGDKNGKIDIHNAEEAMKITEAVNNSDFTVKGVKKSERVKNPAPPFTTSTLQQEANRRLGFQSAKTMRAAQDLYEGLNMGEYGTHGLITYMRTDSLRIAETAQSAAREYIVAKYGDDAYPPSPRVYKTKNDAQDAHEAIRPSDMELEPEKIKKYLSNDQYKLYKLIWDRFVSSQMASAILDTVSVDIESADYIFRVNGYTVKKQGYMAVYEEKTDSDDEKSDGKEKALPPMSEGEVLTKTDVVPLQHFTQPPARYTEASFIKMLEEKGIGRPSTITPTITTIIQRGYVERDGKSLVPSILGEKTTELMIDNFEEIVDYGFTAKMEESLDEVANGTKTMLDVLTNFYKGFAEELEKAEKNIDKQNYAIPVKETGIVCEKCGRMMVEKSGRFGKFAACPGYPECKNTKPLDKDGNLAVTEDKDAAPTPAPDNIRCDICGGPMVIRRGRFGQFYACEKYPECKGTKQIVKSLDIPCPKCGAKIVVKHGKKRSIFYSCERYPECDFSTWDVPQAEKCPECGGLLLKKKGKDSLVCYNKECGYKS